jgi:hypothetical protein
MKNIYLMCVPRSGSSYFFKIMSQSPDIHRSYYEPFSNDNVDQLDDQQAYNTYVSIINDIKQQPTGVLIKDTLNYIDLIDPLIDDNQRLKALFFDFYRHINENFYKIKLYRNDIFEQALSNCIAESTGKWSTFNGEFKFPVVNITIEHLKSILERHKYVRQYLIDYPYYDKIVYYEDIINLDLTKEWIFDFLEKPELIRPEFTIKNPPKNRIVANYQELADWYEKNKKQYEIER